MRTTIDKAGRLVIPQSLRAEVGLTAGIAGLVVDGNVSAKADGRLVGPPAREPSLEQVRYLLFVAAMQVKTCWDEKSGSGEVGEAFGVRASKRFHCPRRAFHAFTYRSVFGLASFHFGSAVLSAMVSNASATMRFVFARFG